MARASRWRVMHRVAPVVELVGLEALEASASALTVVAAGDPRNESFNALH